MPRRLPHPTPQAFITGRARRHRSVPWGQGCPRQLSLGWSWTTDRAIAAFYATSGVRAGERVILRRAGNAGALMRRHVASMEVTVDPLADPAAVEVDTTDAREIAELAASNERKLADVLQCAMKYSPSRMRSCWPAMTTRSLAKYRTWVLSIGISCEGGGLVCAPRRQERPACRWRRWRGDMR